MEASREAFNRKNQRMLGQTLSPLRGYSGRIAISSGSLWTKLGTSNLSPTRGSNPESDIKKTVKPCSLNPKRRVLEVLGGSKLFASKRDAME